MRSFEERIAEISRRSDKILKERKRRRKHILTACISLTLCGTLFSVFVLPDMVQDGTAAPGVTGYLPQGVYESILITPTKIRVTGGGVSNTFTEAADLQHIADELAACVSTDGENKYSAAGTLGGDNYKEYGSELAQQAYTITVTMQGGLQRIYVLVGNTLENRDTGRTAQLTPDQAKALKTLLGIPG